jgi:DNA repair protein RadC
LVLVHNHPSGDPTPSKQDIEMTKQVAAAGEKLNVVVHDHLIVGRENVCSFKSMGLL